jgi:hypothetical protein
MYAKTTGLPNAAVPVTELIGPAFSPFFFANRICWVVAGPEVKVAIDILGKTK